MTAPNLRRIVVVGGSIAAVTAADSLRANGFDGAITLVSAEHVAPYSRVPLSKGVLAGTHPPESAFLEPLDESVDVRLNARATALDPHGRRVTLTGGQVLSYDGLIVATGASPFRLAVDGQIGEHVVRNLADAAAIAERAADATTAVVVGAGFLGMEIASTLTALGITVTVVDREPPLRRLVGRWLSDLIVERARRAGVRFVLSPGDVRLEGSPVTGVSYGAGERITADLTVTAAGDRPTVGWLSSSGLRIEGGLLIDECCRVAPGVTAAGDCTVVADGAGNYHRTPHWTSAVNQARTAARCLLDPADTTPHEPDPYFWTEQFGLEVKICGHPPAHDAPEVLDGDLSAHRALVQWATSGEPHAAASINYTIPIFKLKKLRTGRRETAVRRRASVGFSNATHGVVHEAHGDAPLHYVD